MQKALRFTSYSVIAILISTLLNISIANAIVNPCPASEITMAAAEASLVMSRMLSHKDQPIEISYDIERDRLVATIGGSETQYNLFFYTPRDGQLAFELEAPTDLVLERGCLDGVCSNLKKGDRFGERVRVAGAIEVNISESNSLIRTFMGLRARFAKQNADEIKSMAAKFFDDFEKFEGSERSVEDHTRLTAQASLLWNSIHAMTNAVESLGERPIAVESTESIENLIGRLSSVIENLSEMSGPVIGLFHVLPSSTLGQFKIGMPDTARSDFGWMFKEAEEARVWPHPYDKDTKDGNWALSWFNTFGSKNAALPEEFQLVIQAHPLTESDFPKYALVYKRSTGEYLDNVRVSQLSYTTEAIRDLIKLGRALDMASVELIPHEDRFGIRFTSKSGQTGFVDIEMLEYYRREGGRGEYISDLLVGERSDFEVHVKYNQENDLVVTIQKDPFSRERPIHEVKLSDFEGKQPGSMLKRLRNLRLYETIPGSAIAVGGFKLIRGFLSVSGRVLGYAMTSTARGNRASNEANQDPN